jgi:hypothetical protein
MKWWKRILRKRLKKAVVFPKLVGALMVGRFLYKLFVGSREIQNTVRRQLQSREARVILYIFGKLLSKRL